MSDSQLVTVVGAGQSGLQLSIGLLANGFHVRVISDRSAQQIAHGRVTSSQLMAGRALRHERGLGLNLWGDDAPAVEGVSMAIATAAKGPPGRAVHWAARLDATAQSVDQRVKMPRLIDEFIRRGGEFVVKQANITDLETYSRESDLVVVAAGRGEIAKLFTRDDARSTYDKPQRALALTYVNGMEPRPEFPAVCFNILPGIGEYFVFPALTLTGPCEIMIFEGLPGGPMDCWSEVATPEQHLETSVRILDEFVPWEGERCRNLALTDELGILTGCLAPVVRRPVAVLPSGKEVLGMGDVVVLNDPLAGQGSNNASKCAAIYLRSICANAGRAFDRAFKMRTFGRYWDYAKYSTALSNAMLEAPAPHMVALHAAAMKYPEIGHRFTNGLAHPPELFSWYMDEAGAAAYLDSFTRTLRT